MVINKQILIKMLTEAAKNLLKAAPMLCELDAKFGDGDHGITIEKISDVLISQCSQWQDASIKDFLDNTGDIIGGLRGGSAGSLWGCMISGLAIPLENETEIDGSLLKNMLANALLEMQDITKATIGDKTMMDVLIPAVNAAQNAPDDVAEILKLAAEGAQNGAEDTKKYISKFGRAKNYKELVIGTLDPGAVSLSLLFESFSNAIQ